MPEFRFSVRVDGAETLEVSAKNWVMALGEALDQTGSGSVSQLACETLPNGTVIARDARTARQFVLQPLEEIPESLPASVSNPGRRSVMASSLPPSLIGLDATDEVEQFAYDPDTSEYGYIEPLSPDRYSSEIPDAAAARRVWGLVALLCVGVWGIVVGSLVAFAGS